MTKQIPYDLIPAADLPKVTPGAFDSVVGVDESTGAARRFPMPAAGTPRAYETRADLPASPQPGTAAYVNNDPAPENNGLWAYLDGEWVKSADRVTGLEGRLSTAEQDVTGLKDFRVEADARLDGAAHDILDLRDRVPDDAAGYIWGVADDDGKLLVGVREDGKFSGRIADPFRGHEAPGESSIAAIADEDGRELVSWDSDGTLRAKLPVDVAPQPMPMQSAADDLVFAVADEEGRVLFGARRDGTFVANLPEGGAVIATDRVLDIDAGDLYETTHLGRELIAAGGNWPFKGAVAVPGGSAVASQVRPMIGPGRLVRVSEGMAFPDSEAVLTHYVGYGQSLSVGIKGTPVISTTNEFPASVLMYEGLNVRAGLSGTDREEVLDPSTLVGFEPLIAKSFSTRGQTNLESLGESIARANSAGAAHRMLFATFGVGASSYERLKKGTQPYANLVTGVNRSKQLASDRGWAYWVPAICLQHGEADSSNADYYDNLVEWHADLDGDVRAITGQAAPVQMYLSQPSSFNGENWHSVLAMYRAAKELPAFTLVGPNYGLLHDIDLTHLSAEGYYKLGEYYAKAVLAEQYGSGRWKPLMPEVVTGNGATIDIEFHVPSGGLVLDTTLVTDPGDYGFEYLDDSDSASIADVSVVGATTVRITLSNTPTGANRRVRYALRGFGDPRIESGRPRGCLRDSDPATSKLGGPLYNWCVHFEETVE